MTSGERIGPYELLDAIGSGGMGEVWKARDTRHNLTVAIKFSREQFTERFEREATAIAALNHSNIITIHEFGEDGERSCAQIRYLTAGRVARRS